MALLRGRLTGQCIAIGLLSSLMLYQPSSWPVRAADRLEVSIEGVVLPLDVADLRVWVRSAGANRTDLDP